MATKAGSEDFRDILRRISPYIIRQWRELCIELGVPEKELVNLEENSYNASLSQLALKGLYLWYEEDIKHANKSTLIYALKICGLRRAEEEIKNVENESILNTPERVHSRLSSRPTSSALSRPSSVLQQRPKSRGPVIKPKKATTRSKKEPSNGFVTGQSASRRGSSRSVRANSGRTRRSEEEAKQQCQVRIRIKVGNIEPGTEGHLFRRDKSTHMCEKFYDHVLSNRQCYIESLQHLIGLPQFTVCDVRRGSLVIVCQCQCLGALESLNQMCKSKRLNAICQTAFITKETLQLLGAKSVTLDLELREEELVSCRDILLSRKFKAQTSLHPTDTLLPPTRDAEVEDTAASKEPLNFEKQVWQRQLHEKFDNLTNRYKMFDDSFDEFLRTLQIILPKGKSSISTLSEVIQLHSYLASTTGVSSGVRTDMVREYLAIINCLRLLVADIEEKMEMLYVTHQNNVETAGSFELCKCLINDIQDMLVLENNFNVDVSVMGRKLSSIEKSYSGLACFVPLMLAKLQTVIHILSSATD